MQIYYRYRIKLKLPIIILLRISISEKNCGIYRAPQKNLSDLKATIHGTAPNIIFYKICDHSLVHYLSYRAIVLFTFYFLKTKGTIFVVPETIQVTVTVCLSVQPKDRCHKLVGCNQYLSLIFSSSEPYLNIRLCSFRSHRPTKLD